MTTPSSSSSGRTGGSHALTQKRNNLGAVPFSKTRPVSRGSGNSQADHRRAHHMEDQHGRPWSCSVENRSGMPTGLITNDFNAPWLPDQNALVVNPNDTSELWIDYGLMWRERKQALSAYHKNVVALCTDKTWAIPAMGVYSNDIKRILGDPPKPLQPIKAAAQENPWILGFSETVDERLYEYVVPLEDRDADLGDDEDYSPDGYDAQLAAQAEETDEERADREEMELAEREAVALSGRAATEFQPPELDLEEMEAEGVGDYAVEDDVDEGAYADDGEEGDESDEGDGRTFEADESPLALLEDEVDRAAVGGRTIQPAKTTLAEKQAPRQPGASTRPTGKGKGKGKGKRGKGPRSRRMASLRAQHAAATGTTTPKGVRTLADGARPAVSSARGATERLVVPKPPAE